MKKWLGSLELFMKKFNTVAFVNNISINHHSI